MSHLWLIIYDIKTKPVTKKQLSDLENENLGTKIRSAHDKNETLKKELEALEQEMKALNEAKLASRSNSKIQNLLDAFAW